MIRLSDVIASNHTFRFVDRPNLDSYSMRSDAHQVATFFAKPGEVAGVQGNTRVQSFTRIRRFIKDHDGTVATP